MLTGLRIIYLIKIDVWEINVYVVTRIAVVQNGASSEISLLYLLHVLK